MSLESSIGYTYVQINFFASILSKDKCSLLKRGKVELVLKLKLIKFHRVTSVLISTSITLAIATITNKTRIPFNLI